MFRTDLLSIISSLITAFTVTGILYFVVKQKLVFVILVMLTNNYCCEYSIKTADDKQ